MAASRELAFRLLHIRRLGAGVRRLFASGRQVGGLVQKARGDIRIRRRLCKFQKGCRLFRQILFTWHKFGSPHCPSPEAITRQRAIRSKRKV